MKNLFVPLLLTSLATTACVAEEEALDEIETSETEQALNWTLIHHVETGDPDKDLGATSDRTCWLLGVQGSLDAGPLWQYGPDIREAGVFMVNGRWVLRVRSGIGLQTAVWAVCTGYTQDRTTISVSSKSNNSSYPPAVEIQDNRYCFLTSIYNQGRWGSWDGYLNVQPHDPPGVRIEKDTSWGWWKFLHWDNGPASNGDNTGGARAVCVDIPASLSDGWSGDGPRSDVSIRGNTGGGWVCGLRGLFGVFDAPTSDWKVRVFYNSSTSDWRIRMGDRTSANVTCLK